MKTKILLVDDNNSFRLAIKAVLKRNYSEIEITEANDGFIAIQKATENNYDVILMDVSMPFIDGIEASKQILKVNPHTAIIALTMDNEYSYIDRMIKAGVSGYLLKDDSIEDIVDAINAVKNSNKFFSNKIAEIYLTGKRFWRKNSRKQIF